MPEQYCFVCASNEGIFLDIFTDGKNYKENIEICLSLKIQKKSIPSTKLCHKCVYELDQCSEFVRKYKKTHRIEKGKLYRKRGFCSLCMELGKKGYIFDLWNETRLDNSIEKLHNLFNVDFVEENLCNLSICLDCRYNLDVLFDLRCLFKDTSRCLEDILNGDIPELPKMSTCVVRRKTTLIRMSKLSQSKSSLDSDASTVIIEPQTPSRTLRSTKLNSHERKCDECNIKIVSGMDMYRYHHTGNTVCKECWLTMDPCEKTKNKAHKLNKKKMETKLCSVFLKDILSDSCDIEKKGCKIERDTDDETIYIISSDDTDTENETKLLSTRLSKRKKYPIQAKPEKKLKQYPKRTKLTRSNSVESINVINKKITRQTRSESVEISDSDDKNVGKRSYPKRKSMASTSKSGVKKNLRESRSRAVTSKKRKIDNLNPSLSSNGNATSSKVRRVLSQSSKMDKSESKYDTDSDNSQPYTCKICANDYENKIVGLTHELTHSKKLEVVLEKVALSSVVEVHELIDRAPSTEFDSPGHSSTEQTESIKDCHLAVTDNSTVRELCDISKDDADLINENEKSKLPINSKCEEDEGEERREEEEVKEDEEKKTDVDINEELPVSCSLPSSEPVQTLNNDKDNVDVDVEKQPTETVKLNIDEGTTERGETETHEEMKIVEDEMETRTDEKNQEKFDNTIESEEKDCHEEEKIKNVEESLEKIREEMTENEVDCTPPSESLENDNEKLTDENEEKSDKCEVEERENCDGENKNESEEKDEKQTKDEESEEKIGENNSNMLIFNGNVCENKLENKQTNSDDNEDKVDLLEAAECIKVLNEFYHHADTDENDDENKISDITEDKIIDATPSIETDTIVKDTEIDDNVSNHDSRRVSTEIEKKLEEMMGILGSEMNASAITNEINNIEQMQSSESTITENIHCET